MRIKKHGLEVCFWNGCWSKMRKKTHSWTNFVGKLGEDSLTEDQDYAEKDFKIFTRFLRNTLVLCKKF